MTEDNRATLYSGLHTTMLDEVEIIRESARKILSVLARHATFHSVLDVGCGLGIWLSQAEALGCRDIFGIDGPWLDLQKTLIPRDKVMLCELEAEIDLGRRFDLVMSLEVAEHLSPSAAKTFVRSLVRHADLVLFSAAIPEQGGTHHVNEQWPAYWQRLFAEQGYQCFDPIRPTLWLDTSVGFWYTQNVLVYASEAAVRSHPELMQWKVPGTALPLVHPDMFIPRSQRLKELETLGELVNRGGSFTAHHDEQGRIVVRRTGPS